MEQFVIVLIIGAISLVKWLMERSAEARARAESDARADEETPARPRKLATPWDAPRPIATPLPGADAAARRLRKALGLPEESELPPPVPRPAPVIVPERPLPLPPIGADGERRLLTEPPRLISPVPPKISPRPKPARAALDELLRSRDGLRKAILAQEILGTPKGLVF